MTPPSAYRQFKMKTATSNYWPAKKEKKKEGKIDIGNRGNKIYFWELKNKHPKEKKFSSPETSFSERWTFSIWRNQSDSKTHFGVTHRPSPSSAFIKEEKKIFPFFFFAWVVGLRYCEAWILSHDGFCVETLCFHIALLLPFWIYSIKTFPLRFHCFNFFIFWGCFAETAASVTWGQNGTFARHGSA